MIMTANRDLPKATVVSPEKEMIRMAKAAGIEGLAPVQLLMTPDAEVVARLATGEVIRGRLVATETIGNIRIAT